MRSKSGNYYILHFNNIFTSLSIPKGGPINFNGLYYSFVTFTFDFLALFSAFVSFLPVYYVFVYSVLSPSLLLSLIVSLSPVSPNFEPGLQSYKSEGVIVCCLFSWRYNPLWLYFHSPVAGFSLLVFEVS
jgi:hypothetical protein